MAGRLLFLGVLSMAGLRSRLVGIAGVAVVSAAALLAPLAVPAGATNPTLTSCSTETFPTSWGSASNVKWACHFMSAAAGSSQTMHDYPQAVWHNGAARTATASWTSGGTTLTATNGHFTSADVNHIITDTGAVAAGLPTYVFIKSVTDSTHVELNKPVTANGTNRAIKIENSSIRAFDDGVTVVGTTVTSASANFTAADVGRGISGTDIPVGATIASRQSATSITLSAAATAAATGAVITIGAEEVPTSARQVNDAVFTSGSSTVTSASAAFSATDVGLKVTNPVLASTKIPANTYIVSVNSATSVTLSANVNATGTAQKLAIGEASASAPVNGDQAGSLASTLILNPALVKGSLPCAAAVPYGTAISGAWYNPGSYQAGGLFGAEPATRATIGQLAFATSVVSFFGYVTTPGTDTVTVNGTPTALASHTDIIFPQIPTSLALCTGTNTTSTFSFQGTTVSTSKNKSGAARPSTSLRGLKRPTATTVTQKAYISTTKAGITTTRNGADCIFRQVPEFGFPCGQG